MERPTRLLVFTLVTALFALFPQPVLSDESSVGSTPSSALATSVSTGSSPAPAPRLLWRHDARVPMPAAERVAEKNVQSGSTPYTFGVEPPRPEQRVAVFLVHFSDDLREPLSAAEATEAVFGASDSLDSRLREISRESTALLGDAADVFGWWALELTADECEPELLWRRTLHAAVERGVDLGAYDRHLLAFPSGAGSCPAAAGTLFDHPSVSFLDDRRLLDPHELLHAIGHGHGLRHSQRLESCSEPSTPTLDTCNIVDRGHPACPMGGSAAGHLSPAQATLLGWMGVREESELILQITTSGNFTVEAVSAASTGTKGLLIPRSWDAATETLESFLVEFRQPVRGDSDLAPISDFTSGVAISLIRTGLSEPFERVYLLDMTPTTSDGAMDQTLAEGTSFVDAESGVEIRFVDFDAATSPPTALVRVEVPRSDSSCSSVSPRLTVTPRRGALGDGETAVYDVTVTNDDTSGCRPSSFAIQVRDLPEGWTWSATPRAVALTPGATSTTELRVTSDDTTLPGSIPFSVRVTDEANPAHRTTVTASYPLTDCLRATPSVEILDPATVTEAGLPTDLRVRLGNQNAGGCEALTLEAEPSLPAGWSATPLETVVLASGQSAEQIWTVTPAADAAVGDRTVGLLVRQFFADGSQQFGLDAASAVVDVVLDSSRSLSLAVDGTGSGVVTSSDGSIDCGSPTLAGEAGGDTCSTELTVGTAVELTATPALGSTFDGWSGDDDCADGALAMDDDTACVATFSLDRHALDLAIIGQGQVVSTPAGVDCTSDGMSGPDTGSGDCTEIWDFGTEVSLAATAALGWSFAGWSGADDCLDGALTMSADAACTATFTLDQHSLDLAVTGGGAVVSSPAGIDCRDDDASDCDEIFGWGTEVTLTATADAGWSFDSFGGDDDCLDGVLTITLDASCTAAFSLDQHQLTVIVDGAGSVTSEPLGIDCDSAEGGADDCSETADYGTWIELTATAAPGWSVVGWAGDEDCLDGVVELTADRVCRAVFTDGFADSFEAGDLSAWDGVFP